MSGDLTDRKARGEYYRQVDGMFRGTSFTKALHVVLLQNSSIQRGPSNGEIFAGCGRGIFGALK